MTRLEADGLRPRRPWTNCFGRFVGRSDVLGRPGPKSRDRNAYPSDQARKAGPADHSLKISIAKIAPTCGLARHGNHSIESRSRPSPGRAKASSDWTCWPPCWHRCGGTVVTRTCPSGWATAIDGIRDVQNTAAPPRSVALFAHLALFAQPPTSPSRRHTSHAVSPFSAGFGAIIPPYDEANATHRVTTCEPWSPDCCQQVFPIVLIGQIGQISKKKSSRVNQTAMSQLRASLQVAVVSANECPASPLKRQILNQHVAAAFGQSVCTMGFCRSRKHTSHSSVHRRKLILRGDTEPCVL